MILDPNLTIDEQLRHLYAAGPAGVAIVELVEAALDDDNRDRNAAAIEAIEDANVDQIFSETDSEHFDEMLDELADHLPTGTEHPLYKQFVQFQTVLMACATTATNQIEAAVKILEGHHEPET